MRENKQLMAEIKTAIQQQPTITQSQLATKLHTTQATISRTLSKMGYARAGKQYIKLDTEQAQDLYFAQQELALYKELLNKAENDNEKLLDTIAEQQVKLKHCETLNRNLPVKMVQEIKDELTYERNNYVAKESDFDFEYFYEFLDKLEKRYGHALPHYQLPHKCEPKNNY